MTNRMLRMLPFFDLKLDEEHHLPQAAYLSVRRPRELARHQYRSRFRVCFLVLVACERPSRETGEGGASR